MTRRELMNAEIVDDPEDLIDGYFNLIEALLYWENNVNSYHRPIFTALLDQEA